MPMIVSAHLFNPSYKMVKQESIKYNSYTFFNNISRLRVLLAFKKILPDGYPIECKILRMLEILQ